MLVLDNQAFLGREEIRLPYKSLGGRPPESPVITCSSNPVNYASLTDNFPLLYVKYVKYVKICVCKYVCM